MDGTNEIIVIPYTSLFDLGLTVGFGVVAGACSAVALMWLFTIIFGKIGGLWVRLLSMMGKN